MRKVLMICPYFPPIGGIGVNRSLNLAIRLKENGYYPTVATLDYDDIKELKYAHDESLISHAREIEIIRIRMHYPNRLVDGFQKLRIFRFVRLLFFHIFWERENFWIDKASKHLSEYLKEQKFDVIYTTSAPFSTLFIGKRIKQSSGLPWVADLRDPYSDAYNQPFPTKIHWYISRYVEQRILKVPNKLVVTTIAQKDLLIKRKIRNADDIEVIYNGF